MEKKKGGIKLIALDMDGTLLMSDKSIHPDTVRDIAFAAEQGIQMVYCSGRDIVELDPYTGTLPLIRYGICTSGSVVYDFQEKKNIFRRAVPQQIVLEIIRLVGERTGMIHFLMAARSPAGNRSSIWKTITWESYKELYRRNCRREHAGGGAAPRFHPKVNIYFRSEEDRDRALGKTQHLPLTFAQAEKTSLEMTAPGVSKALGLESFAEHLGIPMEETAGIGDKLPRQRGPAGGGTVHRHGKRGRQDQRDVRYDPQMTMTTTVSARQSGR